MQHEDFAESHPSCTNLFIYKYNIHIIFSLWSIGFIIRELDDHDGWFTNSTYYVRSYHDFDFYGHQFFILMFL
jgi:hypothetical protein